MAYQFTNHQQLLDVRLKISLVQECMLLLKLTHTAIF